MPNVIIQSCGIRYSHASVVPFILHWQRKRVKCFFAFHFYFVLNNKKSTTAECHSIVWNAINSSSTAGHSQTHSDIAVFIYKMCDDNKAFVCASEWIASDYNINRPLNSHSQTKKALNSFMPPQTNVSPPTDRKKRTPSVWNLSEIFIFCFFFCFRFYAMSQKNSSGNSQILRHSKKHWKKCCKKLDKKTNERMKNRVTLSVTLVVHIIWCQHLPLPYHSVTM